MSFAVIDDVFPTHPKAMRLSDRAFRLWVHGLCFCTRNLTDGALTARAVRVVMAEAAAGRKHVEELADVGLWDRAADGYLVHDFHHFNPKSEVVKERKRSRVEAGRLGGIRSGETRRKLREANEANEANASKQKGKRGGSTPSHPIEDQKPLDASTRFRVPEGTETALTRVWP